MTKPVEPPQHPPENDTADPDTEAKAARMFEITQTMESLEEERVALREELVKTVDGVRYFIGPDGKKKYAYVVAPEPVEVDLDLLRTLVPQPVVEAVLKDPAPAKVDNSKFKKAVETGRIPAEVFVKVAKQVRKNPHIRFGDPYGPPPVR